MRHQGLALSLIGLLLTLAAAPSPASGDEEGKPHAVSAPLRFLGLDRANPFAEKAADRARVAALSGLDDLLVRTELIPWGRIEPVPPVMDGRRHLHDWEALDRLVRTWHAAGFEVVPVLGPESPWASVAPDESHWIRQVKGTFPGAEGRVLVAESEGARPPKSEHWDEWERFVQDVAERYDGDGEGDVPDLLRPIRWIQIGDRPAAPRSWTGSAEEYLRLLHLASQGAAKASPTVRIVHGAVDFQGLGHHPHPDDSGLMRRLSEARRGSPPSALFAARRSLSFPMLTLALRRIYSAVAHAGGPHVGDEAADLSFLRARLDADGRPDLELWLVDSPSAKLAASEAAGAPHPLPEETQRRSRWHAASRSTGRSERKILAGEWMRRGEAFDVIRTVLSARAAGASRVFLGGDADGETFVRRGENDRWQRTPAFYALRQLSRHLRHHRTVRTERLGLTSATYRVTFAPEHSPPWMLVVVRDPERSWAGDPHDGDLTDGTAVRIPDGSYFVEEAVTADGSPDRRRVRVTGGVLPVRLTSAPIYVMPDV